MTVSEVDWFERFAAKLNVEPPTDEQVSELLSIAGVAAHTSQRTAAPISCWLVGRSGVNPIAARRIAEQVSASFEATIP